MAVAGRGGDVRFTELVERRRGALPRVALLITGSRAEAEDAVQDAVEAVARSWSRVSDQAGFAYLRTAVVRKSTDSRRSHELTGDVPDRPVEDLGFLRLEQDRRFVELVHELPVQQRAVIVLRYFNGLDDRTIAKVLTIRSSPVRSQAARAMAKLREANVEMETGR